MSSGWCGVDIGLKKESRRPGEMHRCLTLELGSLNDGCGIWYIIGGWLCGYPRMFSNWRCLLTERSSTSKSKDNSITARWLTVEQIRRMQRMRRETVVTAMLAGDLPYEQRGRIRYARVSDVQTWERSRLHSRKECSSVVLVHPALADLSQ